MRCPHGSFATRYATRAHRHTTKNDLNKGCEPAKTYSLPRMG